MNFWEYPGYIALPCHMFSNQIACFAVVIIKMNIQTADVGHVGQRLWVHTRYNIMISRLTNTVRKTGEEPSKHRRRQLQLNSHG